jgi:hypothetical protein
MHDLAALSRNFGDSIQNSQNESVSRRSVELTVGFDS